MTDERPRYRHFFRCRSCGNRFSVDRLTADPAKVNPRCPRRACQGKARQSHMPDVGMDVAAGKAPGQVGAIPVRAYDMAMEIATQDYGLTDIVDRPRVGESTAPKLPPHLQVKADNFFSGGGLKQQKARVNLPWAPGGTAAPGAIQNMQPLTRISADAALLPIHTAGEAGRPKVNIVASDTP